MSEPLKGRKGDGTPYERPSEIETWIEKLEKVGLVKRLEQLAVHSRKNTSYVPSEALVYFLRRAWKEDGGHADFEKVFRILMKRVEQSLCSVISDSRMVGARGIREEILGRFAELIAEDCKSHDTTLDFYEIRFDMAFACFRISALREIGPVADDTVPLGTYEEDEFEVSAEVEAAAEEFLGGASSKLDDPSFRLVLASAIDRLPDDQKQVIGLLLLGFQIDSKDENVMTIARILQCDERTVRNRRDRAYKVLKPILEVEIAP
jgi:hypothetical protein